MYVIFSSKFDWDMLIKYEVVIFETFIPHLYSSETRYLLIFVISNPDLPWYQIRYGGFIERG